MAKSFLVPINMNGLEIQNFLAHNLAAAPTGANGKIYFNTADKKLYYYNGTSWVDLTSNTTYTGTSPISVSGTTISHANSGVSAASKGDTSNQTPAFGGTFKALSGTVNATGHLTAFADHTVTIPGTEASTSAKGLMSSSDKTKLNGIATGAEVNQNAFSNVQANNSSGTSLGTIAADSKTDTITIQAGDNVTLTADTTNDKLTIAATDTTYSAGTQALLTTGTDTTNRVWQAKILHDYVSSAIGAADAMRFKGTIGTGGDVESLPTSGVKVGDTYRVITAGTYAGQTCEVGDLIINTGQEIPSMNYTWTVAQTNIDGAITAAGTGLSKSGTTLNHANSITAQTTQAVYPIKIDAQGHISGYGTAVTSMTPTSHTHGNIQNGGTLQTNDVAIASGDKLVVTDSSDSNKIARTSTSFDGSTTTKALTQKGTFETFLQSHRTYTAVTNGQPTENKSPGFGGSFNVSQISQATSGQITAVSRTITIPNATATTSAAGLMSATDKTTLNEVSTKLSDINSAGTATITAGQTSTTVTGDIISYSAKLGAGNAAEEVIIDKSYNNSTGVTTFSIAAANTLDVKIRYLMGETSIVG